MQHEQNSRKTELNLKEGCYYDEVDSGPSNGVREWTKEARDAQGEGGKGDGREGMKGKH